jgi:hypothetical protein
MSGVQPFTNTSNNSPGSPKERRRTRRLCCGESIDVRDAHTRAKIATAIMQDISTAGLAFGTQGFIDPGTVLIVRNQHVERTATVRHCTRAGEGFVVGCEFQRPLLALWF